eukprot:SAG11_NODE_7996_length_1072_cov_1.130524_1_plen_153_part_00
MSPQRFCRHLHLAAALCLTLPLRLQCHGWHDRFLEAARRACGSRRGHTRRRGAVKDTREYRTAPPYSSEARQHDSVFRQVREVREETGVETRFVALVAMRESQRGPFETTDCYCVCVLALANPSATPTPAPQEAEILNASCAPYLCHAPALF